MNLQEAMDIIVDDTFEFGDVRVHISDLSAFYEFKGEREVNVSARFEHVNDENLTSQYMPSLPVHFPKEEFDGTIINYSALSNGNVEDVYKTLLLALEPEIKKLEERYNAGLLFYKVLANVDAPNRSKGDGEEDKDSDRIHNNEHGWY